VTVRTVFSSARYEDSQRAHLAAQTQFYPKLFPGLHLTFEPTGQTIADLDYAIDCKLAVTVPGFRAPICLAIQERWRPDLDAMRYGDVTVTEWNIASDLPSELHKLGAHWFVYGFYDKDDNQIVSGVVVSVPRMLSGLANGLLPYERRPRGDQHFLAFKVEDLKTIGAEVYRMRRGD